MRKGELAEAILIDSAVMVLVYIDEDDVAMWQACRIEDSEWVCGNARVIEIGPVTDIVIARLPGLGRLAVAYLKDDSEAYVRKGEYVDNEVRWEKEMTEEECWLVNPWPLRN